MDRPRPQEEKLFRVLVASRAFIAVTAVVRTTTAPAKTIVPNDGIRACVMTASRLV